MTCMRKIERSSQFRRDYKREARGQHRTSLDADLVPILVALADDRPLVNTSITAAAQRPAFSGRPVMHCMHCARNRCARIMCLMNLTLSVDEQIVERARTTAAAMGLSLNQAVRDYLNELAGQSSPEADIVQVEQLSLVAGGNRRGWRFNRGELHERA